MRDTEQNKKANKQIGKIKSLGGNGDHTGRIFF